jgi:hypothetical protein
MRDLRIDPSTGDLDITSGDIQVCEGADALRQRLLIKLNTFRGEWFLNTEFGVPYFQEIFIKNPELDVLEAAFKDQIMGTAGVKTLEKFELDYDAATRRLSLSFEVGTDDEELVAATLEVTV